MPIAINGSGTITGVSAGGLQAGAGPVLMTAQASTSGSSIDFTGIPSWVKRITVTFMSVSVASSVITPIRIRLGTSAGIESTGYVGGYGYTGNSTAVTFTDTTSFCIYSDTASDNLYASLTIVQGDTNYWTAHGGGTWNTRTYILPSDGAKLLTTGTLTTVQVSMSGNSFDGGTINVMYE